MLLEEVQLNLVNIECMPSSSKLNAIIDLDVDIGDLLPYLASEIQGCTYVHGTEQLNYIDRGHIVAIRPRQITVTALLNEEEARQICQDLKNTINRVHQERDKIRPTLRKQARLDPLTVYRELPRTNCGECGEATCMAFAAKVVTRDLLANLCGQLGLDEYEGNRQRLWELLRQAEYDLV